MRVTQVTLTDDCLTLILTRGEDSQRRIGYRAIFNPMDDIQPERIVSGWIPFQPRTDVMELLWKILFPNVNAVMAMSNVHLPCFGSISDAVDSLL